MNYASFITLNHEPKFNNMHIAVLSDPANFHTQKWARALISAGAKVTIFSFSPYKIEDIPCVQIPPSYTYKGRITYLSYLYTTRPLINKLYEREVDIANPINITPFGVWLARSGFRPTVSIAMGADILEYPPDKSLLSFPEDRRWSRIESETSISKALNQIKWPIFRHQVKKALDHSDVITGDNLRLVEAVRDWFDIPSEKVILNRWGIEPHLFGISPGKKRDLYEKYQIRDWQTVVLSPRGLKPIYQGDIILKAFELLLHRGVRDIKFIMLSAGYNVPQDLREKAIDLSQKFSNFHVELDLVPYREVMALWNIVDAFISAPVYDGQSNALNEGRYAGAIPIVNDIPANRELIHHERNGYFVSPFTAEHLADAILHVQEYKDHYKSRFAQDNHRWVIENALLPQNVQHFIQVCRQIKSAYAGERFPAYLSLMNA